jgi:hypothetical protein
MSGPLDFTNENIENTYQRVLQTDGTIVYDGTGSVFPIGASIANVIDTNITVGGIPSGSNFPAGTSIENIIRELLITYIPPGLSSLSLRNGGSTISTAARDVGASFIIDTASFNASTDSPGGLYAVSSSFTSTGADMGPINYYFGDNVLAGSNTLSIGGTYTITRNTAGNVTFTVNAKRPDTFAPITGTSTNMSFQFRNYLAASTTIIATNSDAQSVITNDAVTSQLDTDRVWTTTCNAANDTLGKYTYIIYPASYGDLSTVIQNGALPVLTAFTKLGDFTITNTNGVSLSVRVYKSNADKAFASGVTLAIS